MPLWKAVRVSQPLRNEEEFFDCNFCNTEPFVETAPTLVPDYTRVGASRMPLVDLPLDAVGALPVLFQSTTAMALAKAEGGIAVVGIGVGNQQVSNRMFSTLTKPVSVNPVRRKEPLVVVVSLDVPL